MLFCVFKSLLCAYFSDTAHQSSPPPSLAEGTLERERLAAVVVKTTQETQRQCGWRSLSLSRNARARAVCGFALLWRCHVLRV